MKKARVAINGFGRIGRTFFRLGFNNPYYEIVAINDLGDVDNLAYLLQYDTVYGRGQYDVSVKDGNLVIDGNEISVTAERDPLKLQWKEQDIDIVLEATGVFASYEKAKVHLEAGAKRIVISAPVKDNPNDAGVEGSTILMGMNQSTLASCSISSNASCTTNAVSPVIGILNEQLGIEKAILNTVHAYTATQAIVDGPAKKDFRKGRAGAQNIIPSTTGAAVATTLVHTDLAGKFDGISMRVPVPVGSIVDVTFVAKKDTSVEEVNKILTEAAQSEQWSGIFSVTDEPIVSSDIIGIECASLADLSFTRVVGGNLVKVLAWYDNETSYTSTLVSHMEEVAKTL